MKMGLARIEESRLREGTGGEEKTEWVSKRKGRREEARKREGNYPPIVFATNTF